MKRLGMSFLALLALAAAFPWPACVLASVDCRGRMIYAHQLPQMFNEHLMLQATDYEPARKKWYTEQMLRVIERLSVNGGFGPLMQCPVARPALQNASAWYSTDQFALEVLFHARLKAYPCLAPSYHSADLVYVPYFGGLDMARFMHEADGAKEQLARQLVRWLQAHPAWGRHQGRDHFLVLGRETWDFRKSEDGIWGNNLLNLAGIKNNVLVVSGESRPWLKNDFCAPKPTGFHPRTQADEKAWVAFVRAQARPFLFSFVAGRRKNTTVEGRLREKLFWQCGTSDSCYLGDCDANFKLTDGKWVPGCESPRYIMRTYLNAKFCLHPRGDSCNRRSVLDSMLAGCIPVVFEECTLQQQYGWHVHTKEAGKGKFFVHIPSTRLKGEHDSRLNSNGEQFLMIEKVLRAIPPEKVRAMRRKVLSLVPRITYGGWAAPDGSMQPPDFKDAFDIIIDGLLKAGKRNINYQR